MGAAPSLVIFHFSYLKRATPEGLYRLARAVGIRPPPLPWTYEQRFRVMRDVMWKIETMPNPRLNGKRRR